MPALLSYKTKYDTIGKSADIIKMVRRFRMVIQNNDLIEIEKKRKEFVKKYDRESLHTLTLSQYAMGHGDSENFCWWLERGLKSYGNITGTPVMKFGVWYDKNSAEYRCTQKYGETPEEAFITIRNNITELLIAGENLNFNAIRENSLAPLVKYKLLAIYYPKYFFTIYSIRHLTYFCEKADITVLSDDDELILQNKLIKLKESMQETIPLSLLEFSKYLYDTYGVPPTDDTPVPKRKRSILKKKKNELSSFDKVHKKTKLTTYESVERSRLVSAYVKERADGSCQLCDMPAPFYKKNGEAYLECHHVIWLSRNGEDDINNAVALCPNCHRKMHVIDDENDVKKLLKVCGGDYSKYIKTKETMLSQNDGIDSKDLAIKENSINWNKEYPINSMISHHSFGTGIIISIKDDKAIVSFDEYGEKQINLKKCHDYGLITKE